MTLIGIGSKLPNSFRHFYLQLFIKSKQITCLVREHLRLLLLAALRFRRDIVL
jgi:hypothetical protein